MSRRLSVHAPAMYAMVLGVATLAMGGLAIALHRHGHTQGDDFALYLRQARSLFDGDIGAVVADNRFAVLNSDKGFSPEAYPWVWPLVLSPFVHLWGLDYDRLKLVVVVAFCLWLVLLHGIVRRRIGRPMALAVVLAMGTSPAYLAHTDQLLAEFPYLAAVALVIWWHDRIRTRGQLLAASTSELVGLGLLMSLAFNVRREGVVLFAVVAAMQFAELAHRANGRLLGRPRLMAKDVRTSWQRILLPHGAFFGSIVLFQLLVPTTLLPDNGNSSTYIPNRFGDFPRVLTMHLGLGEHPLVGIVIIALALVGVVLGVRQRPWLDGPIALIACLSALVISTHFRLVDRYWFQVTPWVVYFAGVTSWTLGRALFRRRPRAATVLGILPLLCLVGVHAAVLPGDVVDAQQFNSSGRTQIGPAHPDVVTVYDAVRDLTAPTDVIAFFRARTMTLLTDRRSFQTYDLDKVLQSADYFARRRGKAYWQPSLTAAEARDLGLEMVWSDDQWTLWRLPSP